jgi:hypothetical protein
MAPAPLATQTAVFSLGTPSLLYQSVDPKSHPP